MGLSEGNKKARKSELLNIYIEENQVIT